MQTDCIGFDRLEFVETGHELVPAEFSFESSTDGSTAQATQWHTYPRLEMVSLSLICVDFRSP